MYKVLKIRIYPNSKQKCIINDTNNAMRFVRNKYIEYINENGFLPYRKYSKILNRLKHNDDEYSWLCDYKISTKAIKDSLRIEDLRWRKYFKSCNQVKQGILQRSSKRPTFISKKYQKQYSFFIIKDNMHYDGYGRRCITIPILGRIRITEKISNLPDINSVTSGYVITDGNKYYLAIRYTIEPIESIKEDISIGIDLGIKQYATIACKHDNDIEIYSIDHFMKSSDYKRINLKIKKLQIIISKKAEVNYFRLIQQWLDKHPRDDLSDNIKNIKKGESYNTSNIRKLQYKVNKLYNRLVNIRKDFINKLINRLVVITKQSISTPKYITIEDLSIQKMLKNIPYHINNHRLHKYIADSGWYLFRTKLETMCKEYMCELRISDKYLASSKTCCKCGHVKKDLRLSDRVYHCDVCGNKIDRDSNASINLVNTTKYIIYE